jgi:predicted nucleic acid-binding protein
MLNRVIQGTTVVPLDLELAREAAALKAEAGMSGVEHTIDAIVVATAVAFGGAAILTSDPDDISRLADQRPALRIRTLKV